MLLTTWQMLRRLWPDTARMWWLFLRMSSGNTVKFLLQVSLSMISYMQMYFFGLTSISFKVTLYWRLQCQLTADHCFVAKTFLAKSLAILWSLQIVKDSKITAEVCIHHTVVQKLYQLKFLTEKLDQRNRAKLKCNTNQCQSLSAKLILL